MMMHQVCVYYSAYLDRSAARQGPVAVAAQINARVCARHRRPRERLNGRRR
jgi:hypothetical protein